MVERRMIGKPNKGHFKPGNQLAKGSTTNGQTRARRLTGRIISREWAEALTEEDPRTQMTMARRLIRKACRDGLQDGVVALAVLKEGGVRIEGNAVQPIALCDVSDEPRRYKQITREMSDEEAARIYQAMLRGEPLEETYDGDGNLLPDKPRALPPPPPVETKVEPLSRRALRETEPDEEDAKPDLEFREQRRQQGKWAKLAERARRK